MALLPRSLSMGHLPVSTTTYNPLVADDLALGYSTMPYHYDDLRRRRMDINYARAYSRSFWPYQNSYLDTWGSDCYSPYSSYYGGYNRWYNRPSSYLYRNRFMGAYPYAFDY